MPWHRWQRRGPNIATPGLKHAADNKSLFGVIRGGLDGSEMPGFWQISDKEVWQVVGYVRSIGTVQPASNPGDAVRGRALYEGKGACATCHVIQGQGGSAGPELTDIEARRSAAYLKDALIRPGGTSPDGYLIVRARLRDGREISGQRLNEDSFTIQLRDSQKRFHSFRKSDLTDLKKEFGKSEMPSYDSLSSSEIEDLIAYLSSLRGVK